LLELNPDSGDAFYGKACAYALHNQLELTLTNLQRAIELDPENRKLAETDPDCDRIRNDARFQALIAS
jgi:tetratricopeptide (TPR) repeat protein